MPKVKVLFFASAREAAGVSSTHVELESRQDEGGVEVGSTAKSLLAHLSAAYPYLDFDKDQISVAVNKDYIEGDVVLKEGDEVALLPPIAGG